MTSSRRAASPRRVPFIHSLELWNRLALDNASMLWAAGEVIGRRTTQMAGHGIAPNPQERREMHRMVEEKQTAMLEGSLAAWNEWMRLGQAHWLEGLSLTMRNGLALAPIVAGLGTSGAMVRGQRLARTAAARSIASASRQWTRPLDAQLKITEAALKPVRARVAANRKRLAT